MSRIVSASSQRPIEVVMDDGSRSWFFCQDVASYKASVESGTYPCARTFLGYPPAELAYDWGASPPRSLSNVWTRAGAAGSDRRPARPRSALSPR